MSRKTVVASFVAAALALVVAGGALQADEFTKEDVERYPAEYRSVVKKGRELWVSA